MEWQASDPRVCTSTGLTLVKRPRVALWRVFKLAYGPLSPPLREGHPDAKWGRFDVAGLATIYGATHRRGAFVESLAAIAPASVDLGELFDDVPPGQDSIAQDWESLHHMPRQGIPAQWRNDRFLSELLLHRDDWYVDVMSSDSISTLRTHVAQWAPGAISDYQRMDAAMLAGSDRRATCAVAEWVSNQVLDDGSRPAGVRYTSKHGGDLPCWAVWVDLGGVNTHKDVGEIIAAHAREYSRSPIELSDSDFLWAARSLGLTAH